MLRARPAIVRPRTALEARSLPFTERDSQIHHWGQKNQLTVHQIENNDQIGSQRPIELWIRLPAKVNTWLHPETAAPVFDRQSKLKLELEQISLSSSFSLLRRLEAVGWRQFRLTPVLHAQGECYDVVTFLCPQLTVTARTDNYKLTSCDLIGQRCGLCACR